QRTLRRVAARAQGWMPLTGPADLFSTVRSPSVTSLADIATRLKHLAELTGDRFDQLDIAVAYNDLSVHSLDDLERHRDALGQIAELGATWIVVAGPAEPHPRSKEFIQGFAEELM